MICKQTQSNIDTLLRLKDNETLCIHAINQLMDQSANKIASTIQPIKTVGELADFIGLLKGLTH